MRDREGFGDDHLPLAARLRPAARFEKDLVQTGAFPLRQRHDTARRRFWHARHIEGHGLDHPVVDGGHAIDLLCSRCDCRRRAHQRDEEVSETFLREVGGLRALQRAQGGHRHHEHGDAAGDDRADGEPLPPHREEVAQQLFVDRFQNLLRYQLSSSAPRRVVFSRTSEIWPSASEITRCAMSAMTALWVMMAVVVPSSRLTLSIASSTATPVPTSSAPVGSSQSKTLGCLAIARAMALDPDILYFDEPSAGLDPVSARRLDDLIRELRDSLGITMVIVTHELDSIFAVADRSVFLDPDTHTMLAIGSPAEYLNEGIS